MTEDLISKFITGAVMGILVTFVVIAIGTVVLDWWEKRQK